MPGTDGEAGDLSPGSLPIIDFAIARGNPNQGAPMARSLPQAISLVISDVDGTLVTTDKRLTEPARLAVRALERAGIAFAITSSRPFIGLRQLIDALALTTPVAAFNGGLIASPDGGAIEAHALSTDIAGRSVAALGRCGVDVWLFTATEWLISNPAGPHVAHETRTIAHPPRVVAGFGEGVGSAYKIVGVSDDFDLLARCEARCREALGAGASVSRSQLYYLDVTHPLANKGRVVASLSRILSVPTAAIASIGDGNNDVAMFSASAFSIAMGNASPTVQSAADVVTLRDDEDGFAAAVEHWILPRAGRPPPLPPAPGQPAP
jgi:Cof subfamily protein (haloacid dehalogenase superfamily)